MSTAIPQPSRRFFTRMVLPTVIVGGALATLLWTSWQSLLPARSFEVVPVVVRSGVGNASGADASAPGAGDGAISESTGMADEPAGAPARSGTVDGPAIQAPGWVEPAPFPVMVPALTPGIVREVLVLEGERVAKDQPVATLYSEEHVIALQLADAMLAEVQAKRAEMQDELQRKGKLVASGAAAQGEVTRLGLRIGAMDAAVHAAEAERAMKALALERTQVRAPIAGVVMARLATPGMAAGGMQDAKPIVELYDPAQLQVRADVPLADAGLIAIGNRAEIKLDVLPERVFRGQVVRIVHLADIAKNTVQAKVRIDDPAPELKPEMLARVKLFPRRAGTGPAPAGGGSDAGGGAASNPGSSGRQRIWARRSLVNTAATPPTALAVAGLQDGIGTAELRTLVIGTSQEGEWIEVLEGLRAGDLLIDAGGDALRPGDRVRIKESWRNGAGDAQKGSTHAHH